ncbi:MAG: Mov34/MPN/PAD-1 family protein [Halobacteriaceae archaeon]
MVDGMDDIRNEIKQRMNNSNNSTIGGPPSITQVEEWLNTMFQRKSVIEPLAQEEVFVVLVTVDVLDYFLDIAKTTDNVEKGGVLAGKRFDGGQFANSFQKAESNFRTVFFTEKEISPHDIDVFYDVIQCRNVSDRHKAYLPDKDCWQEALNNYELINTMHTHPDDTLFSPTDIVNAIKRGVPSHNITGGDNPVYQVISQDKLIIGLVKNGSVFPVIVTDRAESRLSVEWEKAKMELEEPPRDMFYGNARIENIKKGNVRV